MKDLVVTNVDKWIIENRNRFLPPVSNHFLHSHGQLTVMFVGGPNCRCDFHIQHGEEFFYQMKGKAILKLFVRGKHEDVVINEGEVFLLPARIPHSPQRFQDTMGLVLERKRAPWEYDILRFFVNDGQMLQKDILYETTFHWDNVNTDMVKCLNEFAESEQCRTGKPEEGRSFHSPFEVSTCEFEQPKSLQSWIKLNEEIINLKGRLELFDTEIFKHKIFVYGTGSHKYFDNKAETWLFQLEGESKVIVSDQEKHLQRHDDLLLEIGSSCQIVQNEGCFLLVCCQHP